MKKEEFLKGQQVRVKTTKGVIEGVISCIDTNLCTGETEYSVDYKKDSKLWTLICVPGHAIESL